MFQQARPVSWSSASIMILGQRQDIWPEAVLAPDSRTAFAAGFGAKDYDCLIRHFDEDACLFHRLLLLSQ